MGPVTLELRCPKHVGGIAAGPQIDWSFDALLLEIDAIEGKLNVALSVTLPPSVRQPSSDFSVGRGAEKNHKAFVMHVSDDEGDDEVEIKGKPVGVGTRFSCDDIYLSDDEDSDSESMIGAQSPLMDKGGVVEGALIELSHEHQLHVTEEIRSQISALGMELTNEKEKLTHALSRAEKTKQARQELDRKRDMQYQRTIAEALDNHLTDVQRNHEYKSQIEERKIREDAAIEEAKRKQKALQEEKVRQEKLRVEEARRQAEKKRAEEEKAAALEAERAAKEAAEVAAAESLRKDADAKAASYGGAGSGELKKVPAGKVLRGAESALTLEGKRLQLHKEMVEKIEASGMDSKKEYRSHGVQIVRRIKTIAGTKENVSTRASELLQLMNSTFPQSVSIAIFADKIVSQCTFATSNSVLYGYGHVIVMVTSKVPLAMEILVAKLNQVCMYTVPKHISYLEAAFESRDAYFRAIGYQEEDGTLETTDSYVARLTSYMKLYGAIVQTEVKGIQNLHGIEEGWKFLARFLNALPANLYTAVALQSFIEMAGFALHKRYKSQFRKLLSIISRDFLKPLKDSKDPKVTKVVTSIRTYMESNGFLKVPEGWVLQDSSLSSATAPTDSDSQGQYHNPSSYEGYHQQQYYSAPNRFTYRR